MDFSQEFPSTTSQNGFHNLESMTLSTAFNYISKLQKHTNKNNTGKKISLFWKWFHMVAYWSLLCMMCSSFERIKNVFWYCIWQVVGIVFDMHKVLCSCTLCLIGIVQPGCAWIITNNILGKQVALAPFNLSHCTVFTKYKIKDKKHANLKKKT